MGTQAVEGGVRAARAPSQQQVRRGLTAPPVVLPPLPGDSQAVPTQSQVPDGIVTTMKTPARRRRRPPLPRRPLEWGLAIVALGLVVLAIASLGGGSSISSAASKRTATVDKGVVQSTVSGNGSLEPAQKVELSFGASGEVTAIEVKAGEKVKKGQVLAEVDSSSARASLASAEAQLSEAEEAVETAAEAEEEEAEGETEETAFEGGEATTVFTDLTTTDGSAEAPTEGAPAATEGAATEETTTEELKKAERERERAEREREKEAARREKAEKAAAAKGKVEAGKSGASAVPGASSGSETAEESSGGESEAAAPSGSAATSSGTEETGAASTSGSEASSATAGGGASVSLPTAEANLREAQLSVKSARQEVRETTLRAPISGTIASVAGSVGETVSGGASGSGGTSEAAAVGATGGEEAAGSASSSGFIVLAQLHRLKMEVSFSEADIGKVREGQTATVSIDSMEGTELAGEITKVSVLPSEGGSVVEYPATIMLTQSAKGLRTGMSASAEVVVEQVKNAISVSSEALSGKSVTVEEDGQEVRKSVTTGLEGDETTQIISGLAAGDTVVLPEATVATSTAGGSEAESKESTAGGFGGFTGGPPAGGGFPGGAP
jgi:multidrug efflux pump subunit AcrA (membrane-fusion protein)